MPLMAEFASARVLYVFLFPEHSLLFFLSILILNFFDFPRLFLFSNLVPHLMQLLL